MNGKMFQFGEAVDSGCWTLRGFFSQGCVQNAQPWSRDVASTLSCFAHPSSNVGRRCFQTFPLLAKSMTLVAACRDAASIVLSPPTARRSSESISSSLSILFRRHKINHLLCLHLLSAPSLFLRQLFFFYPFRLFERREKGKLSGFNHWDAPTGFSIFSVLADQDSFNYVKSGIKYSNGECIHKRTIFFKFLHSYQCLRFMTFGCHLFDVSRHQEVRTIPIHLEPMLWLANRSWSRK